MKQVRNGGWNENWTNRGLFGKKIGLVGFGEIAKNFVEMIKPFDMEILINSGHLSDEEAAKYGAKKASKEESAFVAESTKPVICTKCIAVTNR